MSTWLTAGVSLASAVLGGLISPYVLRSRERRATRGALIEHLREMRFLWHPMGFDRHEEDWIMAWEDVRKQTMELEVSALVAGTPRRVVMAYIDTLRAIVRKRPFSEGDYGGYVLDPDWEKRLLGTLEALFYTLWHPWLGRVRYVWLPALRGKRRAYDHWLYD